MAFLLPIVGYAFFGPWGALIGGLLQSIFFKPEGPKGPRLNELNVQHSTVGAPVPIVYGTAALAGNIIWSGGLIETKHEDEQGGKFGIGGTEVTSYTYSVDVAVGICEGPISGIRRIWADADLIYDASDDATLEERIQQATENLLAIISGIRAMSAQLNFELYLGTDDQLPDPTIQSYENEGFVGNVVPAYRGLAYIVFNDFQLEKYGNRIPNFRFEVYSGTPTECGIYSAGTLYPWEFETDHYTNDPRNPDNNHVYGDEAQVPNESLATIVAEKSAAYGGRNWLISEAFGKDYGDNIYIQGWGTSSTPNNFRPCDEDVIDADYVTIHLNINSMHMTPSQRWDCAGAGGPDSSVLVGGVCDPVFDQNTQSLYGGQSSGFYVTIESGEDPRPYFELPAGISQGAADLDPAGDCAGGEPKQKWDLVDQQITVARTILPPDPCAFGTPLAGAPGYCVVNGQVTQGITWTQVSGTFKALQRYDDNGDFTVVNTYPVNPCLRSDDINYSNQPYWEAAYAAALADGEPIAAGLTYGVDYPQTQSFAYFSECDTVDAECVPMAVIVADICRRAGLRTDSSTQIDVSDLTTCVQGYIIGRQMSARDALGPLRMFGLWDAVESDALLKFVERGHALVDTLTEDDLGAHEAGSQAPPAMEVSRVQEKELPRRVRLHFANFLHDHEASEQSASRLATEAVDELDVEMPISMEPDTAKQLAEIMLYEAYVSRNAHRFALDNNWLALEPTDCIEIPVDGNTERVRIVSVDYSIGGILKIDALRDDDGSYVSTAIATPGAPSGGVPGGPGSGPICPSGLVLLDIPCLNASHSSDAGYYAAIYSTCPELDSWACAELYRSNDGGVTFGRVARTNEEVTVGEIDSITGPATDPTLPGDSPPYDTSNSITVTLFVGELESITDAQIDAGQNMAAVGHDGEWVIIQFKTAVLDTGNTWVLNDLIWGLNDTQHLLGTTSAGDTFVLLSDSALLRIPESPDAIGQSKEFKVVTCGEAVDAVDPQSFTTWGLCYQRPCPSTVISATTTEPPVGADDGDAYLLPNDTSLSGVWANHGGEITKWSDETDSWVYCTPTPGTIIHVIDIGGDSSTSGDGGDVIVDEDGNTTPAPWARSNKTYLTYEDERTTLPNSLPLIAGDNITFEQDTSGLIIHGAAGGGFDTSDTSDIGIALNELTDVVVPTPAPGDVLVYDGTNGWVNMPIEDVPGGGGGGMGLVGEDTLVAPGTTLTVAGLDLDVDQEYFVTWSIDNQSGVPMAVGAYFNNDITNGNYDSERFGSSSGADGSAGANNPFIVSGIVTGLPISGHGYIRHNFDHKPYIQGQDQSVETTTRIMGAWVVQHRTAANVTRFDLVSPVNMAAGSRLRVYMMGGGGDTSVGGGFPNATYLTEQDETADLPNSLQLVAGTNISFATDTGGNTLTISSAGTAGSGGRTLISSNTVTGAAATTLTVSGLNLQADLRYWIEMEVLSVSGAITLALTWNADTTATNYDTQGFETAGGTSGGSRTNTAVLLTMVANDTCSIDGELRLTVEDRPRYMYEYATGETTFVKRGQGAHNWRTAATNVTSLTLTANAANALGIGTSIKVWG